jgi:hypothetical protein
MPFDVSQSVQIFSCVEKEIGPIFPVLPPANVGVLIFMIGCGERGRSNPRYLANRDRKAPPSISRAGALSCIPPLQSPSPRERRSCLQTPVAEYSFRPAAHSGCPFWASKFAPDLSSIITPPIEISATDLYSSHEDGFSRIHQGSAFSTVVSDSVSEMYEALSTGSPQLTHTRYSFRPVRYCAPLLIV